MEGRWLSSPDGRNALGVVSFATHADAEAASAGPRRYGNDPSRAWQISRVEIYDDTAHAARA